MTEASTDLSSLIERIEKSEGADYELDLAVAGWAADQRIPLACYDNKPINYDVRLWLESAWLDANRQHRRCDDAGRPARAMGAR